MKLGLAHATHLFMLHPWLMLIGHLNCNHLGGVNFTHTLLPRSLFKTSEIPQFHYISNTILALPVFVLILWVSAAVILLVSVRYEVSVKDFQYR